MNESEFEDQLRALRPSRPSRELESKIARGIGPVAVPRAGVVPGEKKSLLERFLPALGWAAVGAAAAVTVMLSLNLAKGNLPRPQADTVAVNPTNEPTSDGFSGDVLDASDEGIVDDGSNVGRVIRYSSVERRSWTDSSGALTVVEVPREDVLVLPVTIQ